MDRDSLDRHITGNYGEDFLRGWDEDEDEGLEEAKPPKR